VVKKPESKDQDGKTNQHTNKPAYKQTNIQTNKQKNEQTNKQTYKKQKQTNITDLHSYTGFARQPRAPE
jgi:hypothetical protein